MSDAVLITVAQLRALCQAPDPTTLRGLRDRALLTVLLASGLSIETLVQLEVTHLRCADGACTLTMPGDDGQAAGTRPLSPTAGQWTEQWLQARPCASAWLFTGFAGRGDRRATARAMSATAAYQIVRQYLTAIGLDHVRPHDLRPLSMVMDLLDVVVGAPPGSR